MAEVGEPVNGQIDQEDYDALLTHLETLFRENPADRRDELIRQKIEKFGKIGKRIPGNFVLDVWMKLLHTAAMSVENFASPGKGYFLIMHRLARAFVEVKETRILPYRYTNWLNPEKIDEHANLLSREDAIHIIGDLEARGVYTEFNITENSFYIRTLLDRIYLPGRKHVEARSGSPP